LLLGLGPAQLVVVVAGVAAALALVSTWPNTGGFVSATGVIVVAGVMCRPVAGRPPLRWIGLLSGFWARKRSEVLGPPPTVAVPGAPLMPVPWRFPAPTLVAGTYLNELPSFDGSGPIGVILDARAGTAAAVLRARGTSFCLLDGPDQEHRLAAWAGVLESLSSHLSSLVRLQWCQRARPADSEALVARLLQSADPARPGYRAHLELVGGAGERAWRHETFLVLAVQCPFRRRRLDEHAAELMRSEVGALRTQLRNAGISCDGVLDGPGVATAIGSFLVPGLDRAPSAHPWPLAVEEHWDVLHADGNWYRTYWVAEWPRSYVAPDFLSPLLTGRGRRSFSVVMAPVPPERAIRDAESSRTAQVADAQLRAQGGFLETAQHRRQAEAVEAREAELADGRGAFQLAGYVTVAASNRAELEQAGHELERAAGAARLSLRPLFGQQREALTWALPLGRGV
jgi:hypothetical protein